MADLDRVKVSSDGKTVADHARAWVWHQTVTETLPRAPTASSRPPHPFWAV